MKRRWSKAQLVVLGRGRPEEAVLLACKNNAGGNGSGPTDNQTFQCQVRGQVSCLERAPS